VILKELRRLGLFDGTFKPDHAQPPLGKEDIARNQARAIKIWSAAKLAERALLLERYLRSRGLTIPIPRALRWARSCRHPSGVYCSAMIARVDGADGEQIGVHRTYLRPDGLGKAPLNPPRAALGPIKGGAIRLAGSAPLLLVGEGIETCLSAMQACELPAWAAVSAGGLEQLVLPDIVREVVILVDHDRNGVGQRSADRAARRWVQEGRRVRIALPPEPGDFNDVLAGQSYAKVHHVG
jgi:hypothetical protein